MSFYEQLEKLCKMHDVKPSNIVQQLGMSKGSMSNWKKGGIPSGEAVVRFAKHFDVSTDYLLLGDEKKASITSKGTILSVEDNEWLELIHQLPLKKQYELKGYAKRMLDEESDSQNTLKQAK